MVQCIIYKTKKNLKNLKNLSLKSNNIYIIKIKLFK